MSRALRSCNAVRTCELQEEEEKEGVEQTRMKESAARQKDVALEEMINATAKEAQDQAKSKTLDKQEQLSELSRALAVLASASVRVGHHFVFSWLITWYMFRQCKLLTCFLFWFFQSVSMEREEFLRLVKKEVDPSF